MIITDISNQKRKDRYNLFVDGSFYSGIGAEALIKNGIKVGKEFSKEQLAEIVFESEVRDAFEKLLTIISRQLYTKFEIKQKLIKYGFGENVIINAIKKAEDYGYVNDEHYAKLLVESKKNKSKMEVKSILFKKGVCNQTITEQTEVINEEQEKESALKLAEKYMKNKEINQKSLAGLYGYLSRKGFMSNSVNFAMRKYKFDDFEE